MFVNKTVESRAPISCPRRAAELIYQIYTGYRIWLLAVCDQKTDYQDNLHKTLVPLIVRIQIRNKECEHALKAQKDTEYIALGVMEL